MFSPSDNTVLCLFIQFNEKGTVSSGSHYQISILVRMLLRFLQCLIIYYGVLNTLSFKKYVRSDQISPFAEFSFTCHGGSGELAIEGDSVCSPPGVNLGS